MSYWKAGVLRAALFVLLSTLILLPCTQAQTFTVLHSFSGGADGSEPLAGVTMDRGGNVYGTTQLGGAHYRGLVWMITP